MAAILGNHAKSGKLINVELLVQYLPRLNECCFIVSEIHLKFDPVGVFHDRSNRRVNDAAMQVCLNPIAYFELTF
jgi:hypothetical protein